MLDENVFESQRARLRAWRIHLYQIGRDAGRKGMHDDEIIPLPRKIRRPTFISRDRDFFSKKLASDDYSLVFLDVGPLDIAEFVRRLLRHADFKTWNQRRGCVARVSSSGVAVWRVHTARLSRYSWMD